MLSTITLLTALAFAAIYPLCFWVSYDDPLKNNFHKFHIALPNTVGGVVLVFVWLMDFPIELKIYVTVWKVVFWVISKISWDREYPDPKLISIPCLLGIVAFCKMQSYMISGGWETASIGILSGLIFCSSLFAMNLGHEYLNVHGLSTKFLMRSVNAMWILIGVRALWDLFYLFQVKLIYQGDAMPIYQFIGRMDGFLLIIGLFFGTIFPLTAIYFAREVLKLKNTQSTTGILYVILCSVIIGDIGYKYYLVKFGIAL